MYTDGMKTTYENQYLVGDINSEVAWIESQVKEGHSLYDLREEVLDTYANKLTEEIETNWRNKHGREMEDEDYDLSIHQYLHEMFEKKISELDSRLAHLDRPPKRRLMLRKITPFFLFAQFMDAFVALVCGVFAAGFYEISDNDNFSLGLMWFFTVCTILIIIRWIREWFV